MRIGSLSNLAFQKWDPAGQRALVEKFIPGYVQPAEFDLYSQSDTLSIDGTLVGTSTGNLASQIDTLQAMFRNRLVVWIDATDQYPQLIRFCRITKLSGPTVQYSLGPNIASFSLEAKCLLPWGTVQVNPWPTTGIYFRDLSGIGREYVLNPLDMNCNFTIDNTNKLFSWEFIVDNQNHFSGSQSIINNFSTTTNLTQINGSGGVFAVDPTIYRGDNGAQSVKFRGTSDASGNFGMQYAPSAAVSLYQKDFWLIWARCNFGGNSSGTVNLTLSDGTNSSTWSYSNVPANVWRRYVMPVNNPTSRSGTLNVSAVTKFQLVSLGAASASTLNWFDELAADTGFNTYLELMIPDNVSQNQGALGGNAISVQSWNGSSYQNWMAFDAFGSVFNQNVSFYCLDGTVASSIYNYSGGPGYYTAYPPGLIGSTQNVNNNGSNPTMSNASITYNTSWGTMWRVGIGARLAPATTDSLAGNYPSDDLTGSQAINKVRIKATVYYANEDTTYAGF